MCRRGKQRTGGFTLVEVLVTAAVGGLVLWGVIATNLHLARSGVRITHYADMDAQVRRAFDQLGHDAKLASDFKWNGPSDVTFTVPTSAGSTSQVTYAWSAATQSFFLVPGASSAATVGRIHLVRGIPAQAGGAPGLAFTRFDRNGSAATTDLATKRIQVTMTPRRSVATAAMTYEAVTASFTLRNKAVE
jgi:prepilin-type N-terminal cleavage/methylation domain-containing protein